MEIAMTANELLPCPFCGGEAELTSRDGETPWDEIGVIYCPGCNSKYENTMDLFDPASTWNRRAPLTRAALAASPAVQEIVAEAFRAGFNESGEGWNGEHPCTAEAEEWLASKSAEYAAAIRARGEG
jgi:Lar family restriction alleviation protein